MFIMQNKESRLIQAARRTLRAEAILVVVILVIVSWSIFGLYKLSTGSDTIFGYSFSKSKQDSTSNSNDPNSSQTNLDLREELKINGRNFGSYKIPLNQSYNTASVDANRNRLLQELLNGQTELYSNLSPTERSNIDQAGLFKTRPQKSSEISNQHQGDSPIRQDESDYSTYQPDLYGGVNKNKITDTTPLVQQKHDEVDEELSLIRDREPAESKQDENESYVEDGSNNKAPTIQSPAYYGEDYQPEVAEEGSVVGDEEAEEPLEDNVVPDSHTSQQTEADVIGPEQASEGEEPSLAEEQEQAKEGSAEVDDEVDKMTQPTSGVAQQQSLPFDYSNTVKFDDTPQPSPVDTIAKETDLRLTSNKTMNAPYETQRNSSSVKTLLKPKKSKQHLTSVQNEILSEDGHLKVFLKNLTKPLPTNSTNLTSKTKTSLKVQRVGPEVKNENMGKRHKRSVEGIIQAPYEMDNYFKSLNLEGLIDSAFHKKIEESSESSPDNDSLEARGSNVTEETLPTELRMTKVKKMKKENRIKKRNKNSELVPSESFTNVRRNNNSSRRQDNLDYLANLINSSNLLKTHKQSQVPAPTLSYNMSIVDPKVSSSQKYIDFDALLSPSANEKHSSNSKKKHKQEKIDSKKKTALGTSKGGHKKKKLDKEEKKFLKEKRFKAAKKGKKVTKGQGGSGGKKGKKLFKDRGYKKKGFKNVAHKEEWGHKKSYFDEFRDKDFKKKWKKFDDKYNYAQMKKFQAKDEKGAKKLKEHDERFKKNNDGKWRKSFQKHSKEHKESSQKKRKSDDFD